VFPSTFLPSRSSLVHNLIQYSSIPTQHDLGSWIFRLPTCCVCSTYPSVDLHLLLNRFPHLELVYLFQSSTIRSNHHSSSYRSGTDPISPISNQRVAQRANANPRPSTNFRRPRLPTTAIPRHQPGLPHLCSSIPHSNPNLAQDGVSIERRR